MSVAAETALKPLVYTGFVVCAFLPVAIAQTLWYGSRVSAKFSMPLDFGKSFRGKRIFGEHKTLRGIIVFVPLASTAFFLLHQLVIGLDLEVAYSLWELTPSGYAVLGLVAGLGFMLGELPNSFVKRQLGIPPGEMAAGRTGQMLQRLCDRLDSTIGLLIAMSLLVEIPWQMWAYLIVAGPAVHFVFSTILTRLALKGVPS